MCGELKYPDLVMKIGYENTDSVCLRILGYFPGFLCSCLPVLAFFWDEGLFERERLRGLIAFSLLLVNDPSETISKQLCKK
jgi:hypothetical protein